jgi:MoxR-like ATPase
MSSIPNDELIRAAEWLQTLRREVGKAVVGQKEAVDQTLVALVASGHVLIEGVPGLGKTLLARALAQAMSLRYARVQFTPDLMPSDITGHSVLDPSTRGESGMARCACTRGRCSPTCCWPMKSTARRPRPRAPCSK